MRSAGRAVGKYEKQKSQQVTKTRYIAKLRKLRDAHKDKLEKQVDDVKDCGYVEGKKTYARQVEATKNIFFQCGWKVAAEKLGLAQDSDVFKNPLAAFILAHTHAYSNAVQ